MPPILSTMCKLNNGIAMPAPWPDMSHSVPEETVTAAGSVLAAGQRPIDTAAPRNS